MQAQADAGSCHHVTVCSALPVQGKHEWQLEQAGGLDAAAPDDDGIPSLYAVTSDSESPSRTPFQSVVLLLVVLLLLLSTTPR